MTEELKQIYRSCQFVIQEMRDLADEMDAIPDELLSGDELEKRNARERELLARCRFEKKMLKEYEQRNEFN